LSIHITDRALRIQPFPPEVLNCRQDCADYSSHLLSPISTIFYLLSQALLSSYYGIKDWKVPDKYLCPPIPSRADYVHHVSDLISSSSDGKYQVNVPYEGKEHSPFLSSWTFSIFFSFEVPVCLLRTLVLTSYAAHFNFSFLTSSLFVNRTYVTFLLRKRFLYKLRKEEER
jgi:RNA methyltransferase